MLTCKQLFLFYCNLDTGVTLKETMSSNNLFKLCLDFEIIPLVSKKDIYKVFRSHTNTELVYHKFENCLIEIVHSAYDKHPYNSKYPSQAEKLGALFQKMELGDWNMTRKRLETQQE